MLLASCEEMFDNPMSHRFSPTCSSRSCIILGFIFGSMIIFKLIFIYNVKFELQFPLFLFVLFYIYIHMCVCVCEIGRAHV